MQGLRLAPNAAVGPAVCSTSSSLDQDSASVQRARYTPFRGRNENERRHLVLPDGAQPTAGTDNDRRAWTNKQDGLAGHPATRWRAHSSGPPVTIAVDLEPDPPNHFTAMTHRMVAILLPILLVLSTIFLAAPICDLGCASCIAAGSVECDCCGCCERGPEEPCPCCALEQAPERPMPISQRPILAQGWLLPIRVGFARVAPSPWWGEHLVSSQSVIPVVMSRRLAALCVWRN